ncbi:MAG: hypothetical protein HKP61_20190, partial [Dactylosporangium sp.]|nr:hypothetical protein [Dactylosporangium sp.]NNJ63205.1 hypothetical protein [Dactylosporangium sp.]
MTSRCEHPDRIATNLHVASDRQDATVVARTGNDIPTAGRPVASGKTSVASDTPRPLSDVERVASDTPCDGPDVRPDAVDTVRHQDVESATTPPGVTGRGVVSVDRARSACPPDTDRPAYPPTDGNIPPHAVPP